MQRTLRASLLIILLAGFLPACLKNVQSPASPESYRTSQNFDQVFQSFWTGINDQYVFWDIDSTNWDSVWIQYQPKFAALDLARQQDNDSGYSWIKKIT